MGSKEKNTVPFNGTPEQEKALREMIGNHKGQQGALMPVLQQAQEIYGSVNNSRRNGNTA